MYAWANPSSVMSYNYTTGESGSASKLARNSYQRINDKLDKERDRPYALARRQMERQAIESSKDRQFEDQIFKAYQGQQSQENMFRNRSLGIEEAKARKDLLNSSIDRQIEMARTVIGGSSNFAYW